MTVPRRLRVLHVARECAPLAKAGGLGDVVGALPRAAQRLPGADGADGTVLLPAYDALRALLGEEIARGDVAVGGERVAFRVRRAETAAVDFPVLLVESAAFAGASPYGARELQREAVLSAAALAVGDRFDVVHVHDHHAAFALAGLEGHPPPRPAVLTVHNARYHGVIAWPDAATLPLPRSLDRGRADHAGSLNRLKLAMLHARVVSTVSPTHARELLESPEASGGLDYAFREIAPRLVGILNGIDLDTWNPRTDPLLDARFSASDLAGKLEQKARLCAELGLPSGGPLLAFVGRLVNEKGVDALVAAMPAILDANPGAVAALLGTGDPRFESALLALQAQRSPRVAACLMHDERFAHRLYASADLLLMPSWHEPCGLSQMYALRYGAIPVVFPVGGLRDSIVPFDEATGRGTGAWMERPDAASLIAATSRAISWWRDERMLSRVRSNGMAKDNGWAASAAKHAATWRRASEESS